MISIDSRLKQDLIKTLISNPILIIILFACSPLVHRLCSTHSFPRPAMNPSKWSTTTEKPRCSRRPENWGRWKLRWWEKRDLECWKRWERKKHRLSTGTSSKMTANGTSAARILNSSSSKMRITPPTRKRPNPRKLFQNWEENLSNKFQQLKPNQSSLKDSLGFLSSVEVDRFFNTKLFLSSPEIPGEGI